MKKKKQTNNLNKNLNSPRIIKHKFITLRKYLLTLMFVVNGSNATSTA